MTDSRFRVRTCDGKEIQMAEIEARRCGLLWSAFQDFGMDAVIPIPAVTSEIFEQILHFIRVGYGKEIECIRGILESLNGQVKELLMASQYLQVTELNEFLSMYIRNEIQEAIKSGNVDTKLGIGQTLSESERSAVQQKLETNKP